MNDPVADQLVAYNARDINAYMAFFTEDVRVLNGAGEVRVEGAYAKRAAWGAAFLREPGVRCRSERLLAFGPWVIEREHLTGYADGREREVIVIFRVREGKIDQMQVLESGQ